MACNSQGFWTPWWWLQLSGRNMLEWLNNNKLINPKLICAFCWFVLFFKLLIYLRELQKHSTVPLVWSSYFIPEALVSVPSSTYTDTVISHFAIWNSLERGCHGEVKVLTCVLLWLVEVFVGLYVEPVKRWRVCVPCWYTEIHRS